MFVLCICSHQNRKQTLPLLACYYTRAPALKTNVSLDAMEGCTRYNPQSLGGDYLWKCPLWVQNPPPGWGCECHRSPTPSASTSCSWTRTNMGGYLRCPFLNHQKLCLALSCFFIQCTSELVKSLGLGTRWFLFILDDPLWLVWSLSFQEQSGAWKWGGLRHSQRLGS